MGEMQIFFIDSEIFVNFVQHKVPAVKSVL